MAKGVKGSTPKPEEQPVKTSIALPPRVLEQVRYIAFMEKIEIRQIFVDGVMPIIEAYEKKNGPIPVK